MGEEDIAEEEAMQEEVEEEQEEEEEKKKQEEEEKEEEGEEEEEKGEEGVQLWGPHANAGVWIIVLRGDGPPSRQSRSQITVGAKHSYSNPFLL